MPIGSITVECGTGLGVQNNTTGFAKTGNPTCEDHCIVDVITDGSWGKVKSMFR